MPETHEPFKFSELPGPLQKALYQLSQAKGVSVSNLKVCLVREGVRPDGFTTSDCGHLIGPGADDGLAPSF